MQFKFIAYFINLIKYNSTFNNQFIQFPGNKNIIRTYNFRKL